MARPVITLTTDFGACDGYVAQMKGVILTRVPDASLVDVTHEIPPQDVLRAAFVLADVVESFPVGTIHLCVVDPGVGTSRGILAVSAGGRRFVAPDNGVLSEVLNGIPPDVVVECSDPSWWHDEVSRTFHGRDVMAPLVAHWASGIDPRRFGPARSELGTRLQVPVPRAEEAARHGCVLWADRFGNLVTNVLGDDLPRGGDVVLDVGDRRDIPLRTTYAEVVVGQLVGLVGSRGRLEIAVNQGSAADQLGWRRGVTLDVRVAWPTGEESR